MPQDNTFNPYAPAQDARIPASVDRTDTVNQDRRNSRVAYPSLIHGLEELTGLFNRIRTRYVGNDADGFRVGELTLAPSTLVVNVLNSILDGVSDLADLVEAVRADLSLSRAQVPALRAAIMSLFSGPILSALAATRDESEDSNHMLAAVRADLSAFVRGGLPLVAFGTPPDGRNTVLGGLIRGLGLRQGFPAVHDLGHVAFGVQRKYVGANADAGAYTSPVAAAAAGDLTSAVTFTGILLLGAQAQPGRVAVIYNATDRTYHAVTNVVDPVGGAAGTLTVAPAIPSANAILRIPYTDVPHSYNTATDATQTIAVAAPPKGVNGPAILLSNAALADAGGAGADFDMAFPFSNYDTLTVSGYWLCGGADTYQLDILARIDDLAAPGDLVNVNALFLPAGILGVASIGPTTIQVSTSVRVQWREVVARRRKVGNAAASVRFGYMMGR